MNIHDNTLPMIETQQFAKPADLPCWGWRIRFKSGQWSGWQKGYHYETDAIKAARKALP